MATFLLALAQPIAAQEHERIISVPETHATLDEAIGASQPGDVILLDAGVYEGGIVVPEDKPGITIRGVDRNTVIFDGANRVHNAIEVEADGVALENMSAHHYVENGFYWEGVDGFAGRYLTVWNVGLYGIYAIESRNGVMEENYVSGAADAAFYIGECNPCDTLLRDNIATLSAVGFSGTNASGNLVVEFSQFETNGVGILPNSFDVGLAPPPQRDAIFRGNIVVGSGSVPVPRNTPLGGYHGIGIGLAGTVGDLVERNEVIGSSRYGIVVVTTVDREANWIPSENRIVDNRVSGSGTADLALAAGSGAGNCFEANEATTVEPGTIDGTCSAEGAGSEAVATELMRPPPELLDGLPSAPSYAEMPDPPQQPTMVDTPTAAQGANVLLFGLVTVLVLAAGVASIYGSRPRDLQNPSHRGHLPLRNVGVGLTILGVIGLFTVLLLLAGEA